MSNTEPRCFATPAALRRWFPAHHARATELTPAGLADFERRVEHKVGVYAFEQRSAKQEATRERRLAQLIEHGERAAALKMFSRP